MLAYARPALVTCRRLLLLCTMSLAVVHSPVMAALDQPPNDFGKGAGTTPATAKGYQEGQLYFQIGGAGVNAFNFNFLVSFTEQAGFETPVDGGLSVSLTRTYNSSVYRTASRRCEFPCGWESPVGTLATAKQSEYFSIPRQYPMGLGWEFHLGHVYYTAWNECGDPGCQNVPTTEPTWFYVDSTGAEHELVGDGPIYYTKDGSMIRAENKGTSWDVYLPDGRILEMGHLVQGPVFEESDATPSCLDSQYEWAWPWPMFNPGEPEAHSYDRRTRGYYTTRIRMREESAAGVPTTWVAVDYHAAPFDFIMQRITDSHYDDAGDDRAIDIIINDYDDQAASYGHVTEIHVPATPDALGNPRKAVFQYQYEEQTLQILSHSHPVDMLTHVTGPLGYTFKYGYRPTSERFGKWANGLWDVGGQLNEIRYPSGKLVRLSYGMFEREWRQWWQTHGSWPEQCNDYLQPPMLRAGVVGLTQKEEWVDGDDQNAVSPNYKSWTFGLGKVPHGDEVDVVREGFPPPIPAVDCYSTFQYYNSLTWMIDPSGNRTEILYDTSTHGSDPFTWNQQPQHQALFGKPIEDVYYEGPEAIEDRALKRITRTWEPQFNGGVACIDASWATQSSETVEYLDDQANCAVTTTFSDWNDHAGRYELATTSGSGVGGWPKSVRTDYAIDNSNGGQSCLAADELQAAWLPNVVASQSVSVNDGSGEALKELTEFAFDTTTGRTTASVARLQPTLPDPCNKTLNDIVPADQDVVTHFIHDAEGNVEFEQVSFGAVGSTVYETHIEYEYGVPATKKRTAQPYFDLIATVDPATSLLREERYTTGEDESDPRSITRTTEYDVLRRPIEEAVGSMEPWTVEYQDEPLGTGSRLKAVRSYQGEGNARVETIAHYDYAGRVFKTEKLNPDDTRSYQHTEFDDAGRVVFVSEWTASADCAPNCSTSVPGTATDYTSSATGFEDPFGRPRKVTGSLGEVTIYDYFGTNKTVTVQGISAPSDAGDPPGEQQLDSTTTYYTDGLGRLRLVESPQLSSPASPAAHAVYEYDYADRLTRVSLVDSFSLTPTQDDRYGTSVPQDPLLVQERTFAYDALGRQESATHPENSTTTTIEWSALGSPTKVRDALGSARGHHHETTYDAVGRPTAVMRILDAGTVSIPPLSWTSNGWDTTYSDLCLGEPTAWYHGDESCQYAQGTTQEATLTSDAITIPSEGALLSLEYFREVRDYVDSGLSRDRLEVSVDTAPADWVDADEVFQLDSTQLSWSRWKWSPAIPLDEYANQSIQIRINFNSVDANNQTTAKGIGISEIVVKRPASVTLHEMRYDEDFEIPTNKSRGKLTTVKSYDESISAAPFIQRLYYVQSEARLSKEEWDLDWDRDGTSAGFESSYGYNAMGQLQSQEPPHLRDETEVAELEYSYRHGALVGLVRSLGDEESPLIPDSIADPGVEYNEAGGITLIRYDNGLQTHIQPNAAFLPSQIWVDQGGGDALFDTGVYQYDGARNITSIGADQYRYDLVGRLRRAKVTSNSFGAGLDLDYKYDRYGNMTDRATTGEDGPWGLHFTGRTHVDNQISGFEYDANGNVTMEPEHENVGGYRYSFSPENQLATVRGLTGGKIFQESMYDAGGNRWARVISADGGTGLVTLRDASGQVAAEYEEISASSGLQPKRQYARANGKLVTVHTVCGPAPILEPALPENPPDLTLAKTDHPDLVLTGDYTILIQSENDETKTLSLSQNHVGNFDISADEFFLGNNWVRIKAHADCGDTGYSNAVSYNDDGGSIDCLETMEVWHTAFEGGMGGGQTNTHAQAVEVDCPEFFQYRLYYFPIDGARTPQLIASGLSEPYWEMPNTPAGAGHGDYWFTAYDPIFQQEMGSSPGAINNAQNSSNGGDGVPWASAWKTEYIHSDHLGSTRLVTDELGLHVAGYKYYPFGHEADIDGVSDVRMKFTGHERDSELGLDYMMARYHGSNLGRFLSVDPVCGSTETPISWNRYAYALNSPLKFVDPDGRRIAIAGKGQKQVRGMLVETARRPGGRQALQVLADSDKTYTFTKASLNDKNSELIWDLRQKDGTSGELTFGTTTPTDDGATIKLDTSVINEFHPDDKTGVATVVHESTHAQGIDEGLSGPEIEARDHSPDIYSGEASKKGRAVAGEGSDKTKRQAREVVNDWLE